MSTQNGGFDPVEPKGWPRPAGYSNGMIVRPGGRLLFVAGQIGWDTAGRFPESFEGQLRQALTNVLAVVEEAGGHASDIGSMTIYVTDKREYLSDLRGVGAVWKETIGRHYPAMALVEVAALVEDDAKIEIQAVACIGEGYE